MANVYGVDVSEHNGSLNWAKIKASGIKFAIIRTGYGKGYTDKQFVNNVKGCIANGIPFGVYHFSYALNVAGVKNEAAFVLSLLKPYKDYITLPVFFDFEYDTINYAKKKGVNLGKQAFNDHTVAFCEAVKAAGYTPGTYYNLDYKNRFVDASRLSGYVQWYAQYNNTASWNGYDLWQYSSKHRITGHNCNFDINVANESILASAPVEETKTPEVKPDAKSVEELAREVLAGKWGNGEERKAALTAAGYSYTAVQKAVNKLAGSPKKSVYEIAVEVIDGKWWAGAARTAALTKAGYDPTEVQTMVNKIYATAKDVIAGKYGNNPVRKIKLKAAGHDPDVIQALVNKLSK